jgi:raffinose/stachyose/melibiose transport system substrate-binding protein
MGRFDLKIHGGRAVASARPLRRLAAVSAIFALLVVLAACGSSSSSQSTGSSGSVPSAPKAGTINLWLAGLFATATPGTPYRNWINSQVSRFESKYPGSKVNVTLLPANNDQFSAKLQAAFTSGQVPDVMLLYSGGYTTPYEHALTQLNSYINANPGMYNSISAWDLSCGGLDCHGGTGAIYGVPLDFVSYGIFYNKAMFSKAGIAAPPATFTQLLADCSKLKATGVIPIAYGDRDGYSTDNWVTYMYGSYMATGDIARVNSGQLPYTSPELVTPLQQLTALQTHGCVNPDASTHENADANNYVLSKKAAMVLMYPAVVSQFEKALGPNLGIFHVPVAGNGPLAGKVVGNSDHNFVIPKGAHNPSLAFAFIKTATDETAGKQLLSILGDPTLNRAAAASAGNDPIIRFFLQEASSPAMPLLDSVVPVKVALFYYKELQAAFAGHATPAAAMQSVEASAKQLNP